MKDFKKIISVLLTVIILALVVNFPVEATGAGTGIYSTGKAVIPAFYITANDHTFYQVSNITDESIEVRVLLYNADGTVMFDDGCADTGVITATVECLNYIEPVSGATLTFTLDPHCCGYWGGELRS